MKLSAPKRDKTQNLPAASQMPGILIYGGRNYAVGLLWLTVQEDTDKDLLKQRISKTKADFYCVRSHVSQQHGFGWLSKGHRRGMPAAAAMLADQLVGEWHGVFEAENGWWYVQVRSDTITPNGDRFFSSEEEAYQLFQEEATKNIWPHSYAPEKWRLPENTTRELKLNNVLDGLVTTSLVPATLTASFGTAATRNLVIGGLLGVLALMGIGAMFAMPSETPVEMPVQASLPPRVVNTAPILVVPQMTESIAPKQLLRQCGESLGQLYKALPGWRTDNFTCEASKANLTWQQGTGTLSNAKEVGMQHWPQTTAVTFSNRIMTATLNQGSLPKVENSNLVPQEIALLYLEQNMQPLGALEVKPILPPEPPPPPPPSMLSPGQEPPPPEKPLPPYLEINFTTGFGPDKVGPLMDVPALEITQMQWSVQQGVWTYKLKWTYQKPGTVPVALNNATAITPAAVTPQVQQQSPQQAPQQGQALTPVNGSASPVAPSVQNTPQAPIAPVQNTQNPGGSAISPSVPSSDKGGQ